MLKVYLARMCGSKLVIRIFIFRFQLKSQTGFYSNYNCLYRHFSLVLRAAVLMG